MEILKHRELSDLPVVIQESTGETRENAGFKHSETCLSHFPRLLYYSMHAPVCSHPHKAAQNS